MIPITSPLHVMLLEISELGSFAVHEIEDKEFERRMRAIILKGFSDFNGQSNTAELRYEFEQRIYKVLQHMSAVLSDDLWKVGSFDILQNLNLS